MYIIHHVATRSVLLHVHYPSFRNQEVAHTCSLSIMSQPGGCSSMYIIHPVGVTSGRNHRLKCYRKMRISDKKDT